MNLAENRSERSHAHGRRQGLAGSCMALTWHESARDGNSPPAAEGRSRTGQAEGVREDREPLLIRGPPGVVLGREGRS